MNWAFSQQLGICSEDIISKFSILLKGIDEVFDIHLWTLVSRDIRKQFWASPNDSNLISLLIFRHLLSKPNECIGMDCEVPLHRSCMTFVSTGKIFQNVILIKDIKQWHHDLKVIQLIIDNNNKKIIIV